jgi:fatty acid desaturase
VSTGALESIHLQRLILVVLGGFIGHWLLTHTIHDLLHYEEGDAEGKRQTLSKKNLKILMVFSASILLLIALYLTWVAGWPVLVFSVLGGLLCMYGRGLLYHESMMAFAALFLVIGGFYVQVGTFNLESVIWLKVIFLSLFSFFSQYGWLHMYRLDHYDWSERERNRGILITKMGLPFLIVYFLIDLF